MKLLLAVVLLTIAAAIVAWSLRGTRHSAAPTAVPRTPAHTALDLASEESRLEESFKLMRSEGHWNTDGPLLWGYFFLDPSRAPLETAAAELAKQGYRLVTLDQYDDEDDESNLFMLHVEKVEIHSPRTLAERNLSFHALARSLHLRSYDGWDAGPAPE
jgi:hypothetical protein